MTEANILECEKKDQVVDPDVMKDINKTAARITLNGKRHYTTPLYTGPAPSVTTIISETAWLFYAVCFACKSF